MSIGEDESRTSWLSNRTKLTIAVAVAAALVLGGGAASAAVVSLQMAAAEAEAERVAAALEYETAVNEYTELVASGNALVKDLRASLVAGEALIDQATIDEATRLAEYLALTLSATTPDESASEMDDQIETLAVAIADAQAARETVSSLAAAEAEARLSAASLAGEQIRQKVADALAALAAAREARDGTADALASLAAALTSAEASHSSALDAQDNEAKKPEITVPPKDTTTTKPQPDKQEKDQPVDKSGWYTHEEASQAVVSAWAAVPWYSGCEKVGDGYWYRSGGSPSSPPAPPAVANVLGFKVEIINAEKAWVYYYNCP
jgi:hypothetical protein